jgi:hypothetical protein
MPVPQPPGPLAVNRRPRGPSKPQRWGLAEVIAPREALRGLLHDALPRTARLLATLKHPRRRQAVQQAMCSLQEWQLDR